VPVYLVLISIPACSHAAANRPNAFSKDASSTKSSTTKQTLDYVAPNSDTRTIFDKINRAYQILVNSFAGNQLAYRRRNEPS